MDRLQRWGWGSPPPGLYPDLEWFPVSEIEFLLVELLFQWSIDKWEAQEVLEKVTVDADVYLKWPGQFPLAQSEMDVE